MVEERLVPHPFFQEIYDRGIPDVRVIVHRDIPVMAMLRIPTRRSRGKANLHQGALGIGINLESGELGESVYKNKRIRAHPDSGVVFTGRIIPNWEAFLNISVQVAPLVPLKYLGVDLIMDEHRGPLVIEINARPGLQIQNSNGSGLVFPLEKNKGNKS
jgi:alpha-L-glutamate ligase-like protein